MSKVQLTPSPKKSLSLILCIVFLAAVVLAVVGFVGKNAALTEKAALNVQLEDTLAQLEESKAEAEAKAATVVTRPGTSEHNTGFSADFNIAEDSFESTAMFTWMQEHAADYGFVLRFPKDKQEITGITYESWHYRFVGINNAKEMNRLNMCLEEYVEYMNNKKK